MDEQGKKIFGKYLMKFTVSMLILAFFAMSISAATNPTSNSSSTNTTRTGTSTFSGATSLIIDYSNTAIDTNLQQGESGVLTLVIKNVGGQPANNVQVWLPSAGSVFIDKRFYVGSIDSGDSKTMQTTIRIGNDANLGLNVIQARVTYDGFTSSGTSDNNRDIALEFPFRISGNPSFQVTPEKTTYYMNSVDELTLDVSVKDPVKNLQATVSSNGFTVIGSSQKQVGDVDANQKFTLVYQIKPTSSGSSQSSLTLSYDDSAGQMQVANISFGLNIQDAGVDFKVMNVTYEPNPAGPGSVIDLGINLKNIGQASAEDTTLTLSLSDPFAPVDTSEKYIGEIKGGEEASTVFKVSIGFDASTMTYTIPLNISYNVGGSQYSASKSIGIDAGGSVVLSIINVDTSTPGSVKIDVANIGSRTANAVLGTLVTGSTTGASGLGTGASGLQPGNARAGNLSLGQAQGGRNRTGNFSGGFGGGNLSGNTTSESFVTYKSSIKSGADSIFTFTGVPTSGTATLILEYTGEDNKRITQRQPITLSSSRTSALAIGRTARSTGTDYVQIGEYAAVILVVAALGFYVYKKRKKK